MSESLNHTSNLLLRHHRPKWVILFNLSLVVGRLQFSAAESATNCQFLGREMETTSSVAEIEMSQEAGAIANYLCQETLIPQTIYFRMLRAVWQRSRSTSAALPSEEIVTKLNCIATPFISASHHIQQVKLHLVLFTYLLFHNFND